MFYKKINDICEYLPKSSIKAGDGKKYGFEIIEILLVAHGGWHNDTIVTVEKKVNEVKQ